MLGIVTYLGHSAKVEADQVARRQAAQDDTATSQPVEPVTTPLPVVVAGSPTTVAPSPAAPQVIALAVPAPVPVAVPASSGGSGSASGRTSSSG